LAIFTYGRILPAWAAVLIFFAVRSLFSLFGLHLAGISDQGNNGW